MFNHEYFRRGLDRFSGREVDALCFMYHRSCTQDQILRFGRRLTLCLISYVLHVFGYSQNVNGFTLCFYIVTSVVVVPQVVRVFRVVFINFQSTLKIFSKFGTESHIVSLYIASVFGVVASHFGNVKVECRTIREWVDFQIV